MSAGLGLEWNWNSRHNFAAGIPIYFGFNLEGKYKLGTIITISNNFGNFTVIEPTIFIRRYFYDNVFSGVFVQGDVGAFLIFESGDLIPMLDVGARVGYRKFLGPSFHIDPYVRLGYPFGFGIGAIMGFSF
jgi:hypothetical protein